MEQARSASSSTREESAAVLEDLRAQLAQRDRDYDAVHGDNYRMKREVRPTSLHTHPSCLTNSHTF